MEGAQGGGEVEADRLLHLHLVDARQIELHRILGGNDVGLGPVEVRQRRVQGVGLPRAGGTGDQDHPVGLLDRVVEALQRLRLEPELGHVEHQVVFVEQPQHDLLAKDRRQHRDPVAELLLLVADLGLDLDAAVLGQALLGDVELGHDLDPAGDRLSQP